MDESVAPTRGWLLRKLLPALPRILAPVLAPVLSRSLPGSMSSGSLRWWLPLMPVLLAGWSWPALALGDLPDPTRPAVLPREDDSGQLQSGPQLQSVLISPIRKLAVINGQTLHVGEKFGNSVVTRISEREVVLKNGNDVQVLKLFSLVEKRKSPAGKTASASVKD